MMEFLPACREKSCMVDALAPWYQDPGSSNEPGHRAEPSFHLFELLSFYLKFVWGGWFRLLFEISSILVMISGWMIRAC